MAVQKSSLIRQFPEKHRKLVRRILERDGGDLSRSQFYSQTKKRWSNEIDKYSGLTSYNMLLRNLKEHIGCTDDEAQPLTAVARIYNQMLFRRGRSADHPRRSRGFREAAPWLATRIDWIEVCPPSRRMVDRYPYIWVVFRGLAASDLDMCRVHSSPRPPRLSGGHGPTVLIYNTVHAIVTEDHQRSRDFAPRLSTPTPRIFIAILRTLHGIIIADASAVWR